jgi:hypothetical protein
MSAKLLKANEEVARSNTFYLMRPEEYDTNENKQQQKEFDEGVAQRLGQPIV